MYFSPDNEVNDRCLGRLLELRQGLIVMPSPQPHPLCVRKDTSTLNLSFLHLKIVVQHSLNILVEAFLQYLKRRIGLRISYQIMLNGDIILCCTVVLSRYASRNTHILRRTAAHRQDDRVLSLPEVRQRQRVLHPISSLLVL